MSFRLYFNFDPDVICGFNNVLEQENCDLDYLANKQQKTSNNLEEDGSSDEEYIDPGTDNRNCYEEMEYDSSNDEDADDIEISEGAIM